MGFLKNQYKKYVGLSDAVKAAMWFTVCNILQKGITLLSTPIFTRILTTQQYGVYTVYQSWYTILTIVVTLGLYNGVFNNAMTKFEGQGKKITSAFQGLTTVSVLIWFVVYLCGHSFWEAITGLPTIFMVAMFLQFLFEPALNLWSVQQRYDYKYRGVIFVTIFMTLASNLLGVAAVLLTENKAEARVLTYAGVQVAIGLVFYIYNWRKGKTFFDKKLWKYALSFNIPLIPHYLSQTILNQSDRIMIGSMVGESEAAMYSVAYSVAMMMTVVTAAINNSFIPYTYKKLKAREYSDVRRNTNFLLILVAAMTVIAMAFGPEIIKIFASAEYSDAIWVMPSVSAAVFFSFLYPLFGNVEFYYEKNTFVTLASCLGAVANLILNYIFIPIFGYYAAGYTTLACYVLYSFAHYFNYRRILKESIHEPVYNMRFILGLSAAVLVVMVIMTLTYETALLRYGIVAVLLVIAFVRRRDIVSRLGQIRGK